MIPSPLQQAARISISICLLFCMFIIIFSAESFAAEQISINMLDRHCQQYQAMERDPLVLWNGASLHCSVYLKLRNNNLIRQKRITGSQRETKLPQRRTPERSRLYIPQYPGSKIILLPPKTIKNIAEGAAKKAQESYKRETQRQQKNGEARNTQGAQKNEGNNIGTSYHNLSDVFFPVRKEQKISSVPFEDEGGLQQRNRNSSNESGQVEHPEKKNSKALTTDNQFFSMESAETNQKMKAVPSLPGTASGTEQVGGKKAGSEQTETQGHELTPYEQQGEGQGILNMGIWSWFSIALLLFFTAGIVTGKASQVLRKITCQFQKEICPYCFDYFLIHETPFRCTNKRCSAHEVDTVLEKVWKDSRPVGKVLSSTGRFNSSAICIDCGQQSHKRLCPHCHMELPHTTGQFKNYIFSVIGAKDSGKSHYLAVLINQITKRLGPDMNITLTPMNQDTITRYRRDFYDPVYEGKRIIVTTKSALTDRKVQQPLIYSLSINGKGIFGKNRIKKVVILAFFDTAGEDLNDEDVMSTVNKYIYRSDGIILLIDPLQLPVVRDQLAPTTPLPQISTETAEILNRTTLLIERGRGLKATDVLKTPLAVSFSKFDAVLPLIEPHCQLHASANHDNGFDIDDFEAINGEMMTQLDKWDGQDILQLARTRYRCYGFFGITALGCNPHDSKKISRLLPRRIEDPFFWLLAQNNIIRKVRHK